LQEVGFPAVDAEEDPVVDAARSFLEDLMPILRERCPEEEDQPIEVPLLNRWVRDLDMGQGMRRYKAVPTLFTAEQQCAARLLSEFRQAGFGPLAVLDSALAADPVVGPRIAGESLMSFGAGGGAFQGPGLIQLLVDVALSEGVDRADYGALATRWVEALRRPSPDRRERTGLAVPVPLQADAQRSPPLRPAQRRRKRAMPYPLAMNLHAACIAR
jgi:hypothetical protein